MIRMQWYIVTTKHDLGRHKLQVTARNKESAIRQVMTYERCPRNAIKSVQRLKRLV